ncbi:MAG TPA: hypothetical protein VF348_02905 [Usitatibacter sp.]
MEHLGVPAKRRVARDDQGKRFDVVAVLREQDEAKLGAQRRESRQHRAHVTSYPAHVLQQMRGVDGYDGYERGGQSVSFGSAGGARP